MENVQIIMQEQEWEYLVVAELRQPGFREKKEDVLRKELDEHGRNGWELVATSPMYIFKRPKR